MKPGADLKKEKKGRFFCSGKNPLIQASYKGEGETPGRGDKIRPPKKREDSSLTLFLPESLLSVGLRNQKGPLRHIEDSVAASEERSDLFEGKKRRHAVLRGKERRFSGSVFREAKFTRG